MKKICFFILTVFIVCGVKAQSIIVNPGGTHSIGINHGHTTTVVNPNGTHSIGINHGHTTTVVNPNGTHSIGINHGHTTTVINPHRTHRMGIHHGAATGIELFPILSTSDDNRISPETVNYLFSTNSRRYKDELVKLKVLLQLKIIDRKEYRILKAQNLDDPLNITMNKANQVYSLHQRLRQKQLTDEEFFLKKLEIINDNH